MSSQPNAIDSAERRLAQELDLAIPPDRGGRRTFFPPPEPPDWGLLARQVAFGGLAPKAVHRVMLRALLAVFDADDGPRHYDNEAAWIAILSTPRGGEPFASPPHQRGSYGFNPDPGEASERSERSIAASPQTTPDVLRSLLGSADPVVTGLAAGNPSCPQAPLLAEARSAAPRIEILLGIAHNEKSSDAIVHAAVAHARRAMSETWSTPPLVPLLAYALTSHDSNLFVNVEAFRRVAPRADEVQLLADTVLAGGDLALPPATTASPTRPRGGIGID